MPKRTTVEREEALREIEKQLITGIPSAEIVQAAAQRSGIDERSARRDLAEVRRRWAEAGQLLQKESLCNLAQAVLRRDHLYRTALEAGQLGVALSAEIERCRLLGLYPAGKVEVKAEHRATAEVNLSVTVDDELLRRLEQFSQVYDQLVAGAGAEV